MTHLGNFRDYSYVIANYKLQIANFRDNSHDFVERDLLERLAGLEPGRMFMVMKVIGQKVMTSQVMRIKVTKMKSPILYHLSASVLLMRKTTNIIWNRHTLLFMNKINQ